MLLLLVVILLAGIIAGVSSDNAASPLTSVISTVFSPLSRLSTAISEKLDFVKGGFVSSASYMDRVAELEDQVADYQKKLVDYEKMKKQIEAYENFLGVKEKIPISNLPQERLSAEIRLMPSIHLSSTAEATTA